VINASAFLKIMLVIIAASFLSAPWPVDAAPQQGQPVPHFKVTSTSGQTISQDNYRGYVLVLEFFATWCPPCRRSIPHLVELNRQYGKQGLQILGLSIDEDGEWLVKRLADELRVNYPLALAGEAAIADFNGRSVPVMFLVDKKGNIAEIYRGYTDEIGRSVEQSIKRLLAEK